MYDLNNFYTNGFCIIDDFLKDDLSKSLLSEFKTIKDWDRVDQVRNHYEKGGPFEMESIYFQHLELGICFHLYRLLRLLIFSAMP